MQLPLSRVETGLLSITIPAKAKGVLIPCHNHNSLHPHPRTSLPAPQPPLHKPYTTTTTRMGLLPYTSKTDTSPPTMDTPKDEVHILVLETDEPHPETQDRKGSFGEIFHALFNEAGHAHAPPLKVTTSMHYVVDDPDHDHHGHVPQPSEIPASTTAILLTGSMYDAHGTDRWIQQLLTLLRTLWTTRPAIKFSGVCFGHQLLSRLLGAAVEPHPKGEWELAHTAMDLTPVGQKLFDTADRQLALHQMHQDRVTSVPDVKSAGGLLEQGAKVHVWASTGHTEVQGLYVREKLFTSQGHLGFDEEMVHRQIEMREQSGGIKDERAAEEGKERAHLRHDGVVVARAIVRFFHGDDAEVD